MEVALYLRVSTRDKQDISTQQIFLEGYASRNNLSIKYIYKDEGESGSKASRPGFDKLLEDIRDGKVNAVLVYKLDRIGRSLAHLINLFSEFKNRGVAFISATQNINTTTPEGKLFLHLLMVLAEYERELTIDRINSGLARARKQGKKLGRPPGKKDKKKRRKSGYLRRWQKE